MQDVVVKLSIREETSKKGNKYTALFAKFQDGSEMILSFDPKVMLQIIQKISSK